jgi:hypothetical protein
MRNGWDVATFVILLLLGIAAAQGLMWAMIIMWFRRRARAASSRLTADLESEGLLRGPEKGNYRGATAPRYPRVRNSGVIALTGRRLVFVTLTGKTIEIPLADVTGLRESKVFMASAAGGHVHLIVVTSAGELGFFVGDNSAWITAINSARGR